MARKCCAWTKLPAHETCRQYLRATKEKGKEGGEDESEQEDGEHISHQHDNSKQTTLIQSNTNRSMLIQQVTLTCMPHVSACT